MRGDFSRLRFNPAKQYSAVLQQQGRVSLDADANEQSAIDWHLRDTANFDIIGPYGGPAGEAGFRIMLEGSRILIGAGRYYVDGILVQNPSVLSYVDQPYLDVSPDIARELLLEVYRGEGAISLQLTLEVWERLVTALDDPCLLEPALGQADTTARLQTVWRVVARLYDSRIIVNDPARNSAIEGSASVDLTEVNPVVFNPVQSGCANAGNPIENLSPCCQLLYRQKQPSRTGAMGAETVPTDDCGCEPISAAGYQGLENQLYRVEIHHGGTLDTATFKWSRENGSVVTHVTDVNGSILTVSSLGPDANLGYQVGQWVELTDDRYLFAEPPNRPGKLYLIGAVETGSLQVTLNEAVTGIDTARNARMRRWDQSGANATTAGIPLSATPTQLESGIEVTFRKGDYVSGDYWTIPARTANGQIDWPPCGGNGAFFQPAAFTEVYSAPLACIHARDFWRGQQGDAAFDVKDTDAYIDIGDERLFQVDDCRLLFPPLTALCGASQAGALHVQSISWVNDSIITFDQLVASGLTVTLDQSPTSPISGASFVVSLEVAEPDVIKSETLNTVNMPSTIVRLSVILDSYTTIIASGPTLSWQCPLVPRNPAQTAVLREINTLLGLGAAGGWFARARVRLVGRAIFANSAAGLAYLDGQAFGQPSTQADGTPCVGLQFPSGNGDKASDFESWFYVAPELQLVSATVNYSTLEVQTNEDGTLSVYTGDKEAVAPEATVTVNYPAIAATTVNLSLQYDSEYAGVIQIPTTVQIPANGLSTTFAITVLQNPQNKAPATFEIIASLPAAVGPGSSASTSFTLTGIPSPIYTQ
jgi:hypothetical protein